MSAATTGLGPGGDAWIRGSGVLERAQLEKRLLLTFDKDFGELAFRFGLPVESGGEIDLHPRA